MARLQERYKKEVLPALQKELNRTNVLSIPRLEKIVVSMGVGKATQEKKRLDAAAKELAQITGQKPVLCAARKSVSNFKLREGLLIGAKVTLRGKRMYEFLDRLICVAIPRIRDFRGLDPRSFDGRGNFSMGLTEQTVFPEVDADKVEFQQGMNITFVTSARNDNECRRFLTLMGMPFRKDEKTGTNN
ncbi:MAG: 50S ribosomal protein L5 [Phycisphaerae bacterium]|nr:MAG: 50S ribosomal protein L5 [Planctomycetia bacterium]RIK70388.1 MAG: 50S ribosomal protein L5 [Planctomycetota bacterium]GJQ26915.1 MAG: 50S ribosomal protein L5 [Phycisphaerae bacterium]